jgi:putative SOS response-associated peptidase YedK
MCGRYTSTSTTGQLAAIVEAKDVRTEALPARYNVSPSGSVRSIAEREPLRQALALVVPPASGA